MGWLAKIGNSRAQSRGGSKIAGCRCCAKMTAVILIPPTDEQAGVAAAAAGASRKSGSAISSTASRTKPSTNMRLASGFGDAAGAQIEERRRVEVADAGAVAALDVVGVDLELGLGIDHRALAEDQVAAQLVRIGLLGGVGAGL